MFAQRESLNILERARSSVMKHASGLIWANHRAESMRRSSSRQCQGWRKDQRRLPSWEARFGWKAKISNEESATHLVQMLEAGDEQQFYMKHVADDGFPPASRKERLAVHLPRHFLKNFMRRMIIIQVTTLVQLTDPVDSPLALTTNWPLTFDKIVNSLPRSFPLAFCRK